MRACERCHTPYKTRVEYCGLDGAPVVERDTDPLVGSTFDRYRVTERLGGGGMAVVYRAKHEVIDREVAIKILFGELASDREFSERFRREAQAASRIKHPNVVEIFDFGETPAGMSYLVMELLRGETLNEAIQWTGPFVPRRAASVLRQLSSGLQAAHGMGFIHRDLKPGNVMLVPGAAPGQPVEVAKILDFGLVLVTSDDGSRLTKTGQTLGTPHYMAPEQFVGGEATVRSDLYSLGAVLHEMLAGHAPFRGSLGEVVVQQQSATPPPLPESGGLEALAVRLLDKDARKRPESTADVIAFLDKLALGDVRPEDIPARPETLDLDLHQVVEVRGASDASAQPAADEGEVLTEGMDLERQDDERQDDERHDDERATVGGLDDEDFRSGSPIPPPPAPAETEAVIRTPRAAATAGAAVHASGRALVFAALLGGLVLSGALFLVAGPKPGFLAKADVGDAAPPGPIAIARQAHEALVERALARRGLNLDDAADIPAVAPAVAAWREARAGGSLDGVSAAAERLVVEIERVPLDTALLRRKLARLHVAVREAPASVRDPLTPRVEAVGAQLADDLSEAERSRLARRMAEIEALLPPPAP